MPPRAEGIDGYKAVIERIQESTGLSRPQAELAYRSTVDAIKDTLGSGRCLELKGFGKWIFRRRVGRMYPERKSLNVAGEILPPRYQPESVFLVWRSSGVFKQKLKTLKPEHVQDPITSGKANLKKIVADRKQASLSATPTTPITTQ